jgi:hypothetical protein
MRWVFWWMSSIFFFLSYYRLKAIYSSNLQPAFASVSSRLVMSLRSLVSCSFNRLVIMISLRTLSILLCTCRFFSFYLSTFFLRASKRLALGSVPNWLLLEFCETLLETVLESSLVFFLILSTEISSLTMAISLSSKKLCFSKASIFLR